MVEMVEIPGEYAESKGIIAYDLVRCIEENEGLTADQRKKVLEKLFGMPKKEVEGSKIDLSKRLVLEITNHLKVEGGLDPMLSPVSYSNIYVVLSETSPVIHISAISEIEEPLLRRRLMRMYFFSVKLTKSQQLCTRIPEKEDRNFIVVRNDPNDPRKEVYFQDIVVSEEYKNTFTPCTIVKIQDSGDCLVLVFSDKMDNSRTAILSLCGMRSDNMAEFVMQKGKSVVYAHTCKICCSPTKHKCICGARLCSPFCQRLDYVTHGKAICAQRKPLSEVGF